MARKQRDPHEMKRTKQGRTWFSRLHDEYGDYGWGVTSWNGWEVGKIALWSLPVKDEWVFIGSHDRIYGLTPETMQDILAFIERLRR